MTGVAGRAAQLVTDAPSGFDERRGSVDIGELLAQAADVRHDRVGRRVVEALVPGPFEQIGRRDR